MDMDDDAPRLRLCPVQPVSKFRAPVVGYRLPQPRFGKAGVAQSGMALTEPSVRGQVSPGIQVAIPRQLVRGCIRSATRPLLLRRHQTSTSSSDESCRRVP